MAPRVEGIEAPDRVLEAAGAFLASDPIRHNVIMTLLRNRVADPGPGRYWIVYVDDDPAGVVFQSPLHFMATITPMPSEAIEVAVEAILSDGVQLPGVNGEAATAAQFAGHWAEGNKRAVRPIQAQRIYELEQLVPARAVGGTLCPATDDDRQTLVEWFEAFQAEAGERGGGGDLAHLVERRLKAQQLWLWEDQGPVAMAGLSEAVAGVVRVGPVYTPPLRRNRGYASALVAAVSTAARSNGHRCILYTDLANPTSNSIYRAIGYRAVTEALRYEFDS